MFAEVPGADADSAEPAEINWKAAGGLIAPSPPCGCFDAETLAAKLSLPVTAAFASSDRRYLHR